MAVVNLGLELGLRMEAEMLALRQYSGNYGRQDHLVRVKKTKGPKKESPRNVRSGQKGEH